MRKIRPSFIPAIIWFIISVLLLSLPGSAFPKENWLEKIWIDKWIHIGIFAVLSGLFCWAMLKIISGNLKLKTIFIWIGIICLLYGVVMELIQKFWIPNRSFDFGDIVADGVGSFLGVIFSSKRFIKK